MDPSPALLICNMKNTDTIAAIASGLTSSGIGIVRISGPDALEKISGIFKSSKGKNIDLCSCESHTVHYGYIYDSDTAIDEVLVSVFKAPKSYTSEDTVEINCHGGPFILNRVLKTVIDTGIRTADPGEFTKRAFLNGRIDLSEAQAVMDLISSKNEYARRNALGNIRGTLKNIILDIRNRLIHESAFIESAIDDPEHYSLEGYSESLDVILTDIQAEIEKLVKSFEAGKLLSEGINCCIIGRPNVGKSSVFNALSGDEKAIVTDLPGTTRDFLDTCINYEGITLNFIDTAGIHDTSDKIELIGIDRAKELVQKSDIIIAVFDISEELSEEDHRILSLCEGRNSLIVLNKSDLKHKLDAESFKDHEIIQTSVKTGEGIDEILKHISDRFIRGNISFNDEVFITNARQKELLKDALDSVRQVRKTIADGMSEDFYTSDLMEAYHKLGEIIGEEAADDLVEVIFRDFCMGK